MQNELREMLVWLVECCVWLGGVLCAVGLRVCRVVVVWQHQTCCVGVANICVFTAVDLIAHG